jgi:hypothetical protein
LLRCSASWCELPTSTGFGGAQPEEPPQKTLEVNGQIEMILRQAIQKRKGQIALRTKDDEANGRKAER